MITVEQSATLLSATQEAEVLLERAGRTCYKSEDRITAESAPKFVEMICQRNHESVLEHAVATIVFTTDRGITHELVRHRIASFSQESTRYVNYYKKGEIRVVKPLGMDLFQTTLWENQMLSAEKAYYDMIKAGCPPEVARDVLPTCFATDIVTTCNFREWKHIVKLRTAKAAHPKIRALIGMASDILIGIAPSVFKPPVVDDGAVAFSGAELRIVQSIWENERNGLWREVAHEVLDLGWTQRRYGEFKAKVLKAKLMYNTPLASVEAAAWPTEG